ncbi:MAG: hypothetical protein ACF8PN_03575 [Phycisphaerales bacterium]
MRQSVQSSEAGEVTALERDLSTVATLTRWAQGTIWGLSVLLAVFLAGLIGFRNGFLELVGIPELQQSALECMASGVRLVVEAPGRVFSAGIDDATPWLVALGLVVAGGGAVSIVVLSEDRREESGPVGQTIAGLGAVLIGVVSAGMVAWTISRGQAFFAAPLPWSGVEIGGWLVSHRVAAGVDLIAVVAAALWFVAALRLRTFVWLRVLTIAIAASALVTTYAGSAMSNGALSELERLRTLVRTDGAEEAQAPVLLIGHTQSHLVVAPGGGEEARFVSPSDGMTATGRRSIIDQIRLTTPEAQP